MGVILPRELPSEFQRIEWIGTSGTQYINTRIVLGLVERIKVTSVFYINSSNSSVDNPIVWLRHTASSTNSPQQDYKFPNVYSGRAEVRGYGISDNTACSISYGKKTRMDFEYAPGVQKVYKDGSLVKTYSYGAPTKSVTYPIYLMRTSGNPKVYYTKGRLYYFRIEYDGTIREYIPCYRKSDNVVGLFETQTGTFFTNAGTGVFIKGPNIQIDNRSLLALRRQIVNTQPHKETLVGTDGIASFETNFEGLMKVSAPFTPVQDLHGMQNPYPAGASVNLIPDGTDTENGYVKDKYLDIDGSYISSTSFYVSEYIAVDPSLTYTWSDRVVETLPCLCFYDENKAFISGFKEAGVRVHTFTPPEGAAYVRSSQTTYAYQAANPTGAAFQLEVGSTATEYRRYSNVCPIQGFDECNIDNYRNLENSITFAATQSGLGDPSPENYRQINPGLVFTRDDNTELVVYCGSLAFSDGVWTLKATHKYLEYDGVTAGKKFEYSGSVGKNYYNALDDGYLYGASTGSWITPAQLENYGYLVSNLTIMNGAPAETDHPVHNVYNGSKRVLQPRISFPSSIDSLNAGNAQLKAWYDDGKPYAICYRLKTSVSYVLSESEARRALIALGLIRGINVTFTNPSTGDPMTVYGGTLTLNEDGSADILVTKAGKTVSQLSGDPYIYDGLLRWVSINNLFPGFIYSGNYNAPNAIATMLRGVGDTPIVATNAYRGTFAFGRTIFWISDNTCATAEAYRQKYADCMIVWDLDAAHQQVYHLSNVGLLKSSIGQNHVLTDLNGDPTVTYWKRG